MHKRAVITGLGIISSIGNNATEVLASLRAQRSGIRFSEEMRELGFRSCVYGAPTLSDPIAHINDKRTTRFMSIGSAWNYLAMREAVSDAGLEESDYRRNPRVGLIMGSGGPSTTAIVDAATITREKGPKRIGPFAVPKAMSSSASAVLSTTFEIYGKSFSISSACATSAHCIGEAAALIESGKHSIVFAGGHENLEWSLSNLFDAMGALSSNFNETPARASRAYDADRDGFVIAGGAGVVVVEELMHARARGARIYGEVIGYGATSDGSDMVSPSGEGAVRSMEMALDGILPSHIKYINTHGTSTPIGDLKEIEAIKTVFGTRVPPISSTKSLTGHSLGAAGVQEAIYCLLMMHEGFLTGSAHIDRLGEEFTNVPILRSNVEDVSPEMVMSNSFGFGGANATLIFAKTED